MDWDSPFVRRDSVQGSIPRILSSARVANPSVTYVHVNWNAIMRTFDATGFDAQGKPIIEGKCMSLEDKMNVGADMDQIPPPKVWMSWAR